MACPYVEGLERRSANFVPLSPLSFLPKAAERFGDRIAIIQGERQQSWRDTYTRCRRFAAAMAARGITRSDTVAILAPNTLPMVEAHFGIPMTGAVINTLNTRLDPAAIAFQLRHGEAKLLLADRAFAATVEGALALLPADMRPTLVDIADDEVAAPPIADMEYEAFLDGGDPEFAWSLPPDEWDAISLNYTSGTTGNPKGVVAHHRGAYLNAVNNVFTAGMEPHAVYLWVVPMFHCNGWCHPWTMAAIAGTNVCVRRTDPATLFGAIRRHRVTHMSAAPIIYTAMIDAPDSLRDGISHRVTGTTGGAPPPSRTFSRAADVGIDLVHIYGLTETYGPAALCPVQEEWKDLPAEERARKVARQGFASLAQEEMSVRDPTTLERVPADGETVGEIMFRGNLVMKGYLKNPQATAEAFAGGFFHSGDLAVLEPDGYVRVRDRSKDVIISGGENISSVEVEEVLCRHPSVSAAAVVGRPDSKWGEAPIAYIELRDGAVATEDELRVFCRAHLAGFKMPKSFVFAPLPRTSTGKVQKYVLRAAAANEFGAVKFDD
ncbi:MAG TPA: AMP-binding protein [Acetobacteraceae bacterium]|nr:AMP-binding protein [Acetobacteraceae bacterium]